MTVRIYSSADASAPTLTGEADSLNALLLACLVNGYGAKPAAGWTRPFYDSTTKQGSYKSNASPFAWLHIQDNGQSAGGMREARARGYEDMSSFSAGTGPYPTTGQLTNGYCIRKSQSADATARAWLLAADEHRLYLFTYTGDTANVCANFIFGRMKSYKSGDLYHGHISGRTVENNGGMTSTQDTFLIVHPSTASANRGHITRSYTGTGGAVAAGKVADAAKIPTTSNFEMGGAGMAYPAPVDGGLYLAKLYLNEVNITRGELPGVWCPLHDQPLLDADTFSGVTDLAARTFRAVMCGTNNQLFLETSDTWDV